MKEWRVEVIPAGDAVGFVRRHHYSGTAVAGLARYGWITQDDQLVGVSIFDPGHHDTRKGVFGPEHWRHVAHHHRLAVRPDVPHGFTSMFQAGALRALKRDRPDLWAVVTYADVSHGHVGTIYQATNAIYTGLRTKGNLYLVTPEGDVRTMQALSRYGTWSQRRAKAAELGWTERRSLGKHRYVYLLGSARQRRKYPPLCWPVLPYPDPMFAKQVPSATLVSTTNKEQ